MICVDLPKITGWSCLPIAENATVLRAPVGHGTSGELVSFVVLTSEDGWFSLSDNYAAVVHLSAHGANAYQGRIARAATLASRGRAKIRDDGEIVAEGWMSDLQPALWDALRLSLAVSGNQENWQPVSRSDYFAARVQTAVRAALHGKGLIQKVRLTGASGHQMEFPFGIIVTKDLVRAVQPVASDENGRVDWGNVYQSFGKLNDLKRASEDGVDNRIAVLDGAMSADDLSKVATILTEASRVVVFSSDADAELLIAA